jgi:DNA-binding MarR family transcriptional regulator
MSASFSDRHGVEMQQLARAIVLTLLSGEPPQSISPAQLAAELGADPATLERALGELADAGVVSLSAGEARASRAARRIDELGLIGI